MLTQERLKELLDYDQVSGEFHWLQSTARRIRIGDKAGCKIDGYVSIGIDGKYYLAHRLAFLHMTGAWPENHIDHRDGNGMNNAWGNLRTATQAQNRCNSRRRSDNTSGVKGVRKARNGKYRVEITTGGRSIYLGTADDLATAERMYAEAAATYHGEFARTA